MQVVYFKIDDLQDIQKEAQDLLNYDSLSINPNESTVSIIAQDDEKIVAICSAQIIQSKALLSYFSCIYDYYTEEVILKMLKYLVWELKGIGISFLSIPQNSSLLSDKYNQVLLSKVGFLIQVA